MDGFFGLHPALSNLAPIYKSRDLAIIHATGSPDPTRSHFEAQDYMESGAPGDKSVADGWLNRYLQVASRTDSTAFRGVSMGSRMMRSLRGEATAVSVADLKQFDLRAGRVGSKARSVYEALYDSDADTLLSGTSRDLFEAIEFLKSKNPSRYEPDRSASYPTGRFGQNLKQVAQLIKADVGLEVACLELGGWDTHVNQGNVNGTLSNLLRQLGDGLAAFHKDLGDRMENVVVLSMSEFGRTLRENGNGGTDHGHANVMFLMGSPVQGGKVYGRWPGLAREQLHEKRDLAVTTDFRAVFAEVLEGHLGCKNLNGIFPGYEPNTSTFQGLL